MLREGPGALLLQLDIKETYRMVPAPPGGLATIGKAVAGDLHINTHLLLVLRPALKIIPAVADTLQWIMAHQDLCPPSTTHIDDFLTNGITGSGHPQSTMSHSSPKQGRRLLHHNFFPGD